MLEWAVIFLIIALVTWVLGLPSVAVLSADIAKILFFIFIILFIIGLIFGMGVFNSTTPVIPNATPPTTTTTK